MWRGKHALTLGDDTPTYNFNGVIRRNLARCHEHGALYVGTQAGVEPGEALLTRDSQNGVKDVARGCSGVLQGSGERQTRDRRKSTDVGVARRYR